jgi:hypothetical protein
MSFNIFGPTQKRDITVGYISTDRGYVQNVSILAANNYAFKNPGTIFIIQTRDGVKYFNINEVNNLKPEDILPSNTAADGTCQGVVGLSPQVIGDVVAIGTGSPGNSSNLHDFLPRGPYAQLPDLSETGGSNPGGDPGDDGPVSGPSGGPSGIGTVGTGGPIVVISGCGGVGAAAVPIIGNDGGILDIVVTAGGFGYRCPPKVSVIDPNRRGSGVVATSVIGVSTSPTLITYDDEDDFEIYDFDPRNGNPDLTGYGNRVGPDGQDLGDWDPTLYATFAKDPIGIEIARYQKYLKELRNPWWSTRKETPLNIAFGDKKDRVKHDVQHHAWDGDEKLKSGPNTQYQDVEFEVYTQLGSSKKHLESGLAIMFAAEDGSHFFKFTAKNFLANNPGRGKKTKITKRVKVNTNYIITSKGEMSGKGVEQGLVGEFGRRPGERNNKQTGQVIFADLVGTANDNDDIQVRAPQGSFTASNKRRNENGGRSTFDLKYRFDVKRPVKNDKRIKPSFMNSYAISPVPMSDVPGSDFAGRWCTFDWEEDFPYAGEYVFRGMADNIGKMYLDNELIMEAKHFRGDPLPSNVIKKTVEAGVHKIKVDLYNIPKKENVSTTVTNNTPNEKKKIPVNFDVYGQGSKKNTAINMVFTSEDGNHSFTFKPEKLKGSKYDYKKTVRVFPNTQYKVQAIATATHTIKGNNPSPSPNNETKFPIVITGNSSTSGLEVTDSGKRIRYDDDATNGFDENAQLRIMSSSPGVNAKFSRDGTELVVKGSGDVTLKFSWDDNSKTSGLAVGKLTVGGQVFQQINEKGSQTKTVTVGSNVSGVSSNERRTPINYANLNSANQGRIDVTDSGKKIKLKDGDADDTNASIRIVNVRNGTAKFSRSGTQIITTGNCNVTIKLEWDDNPSTAGVALDSVEIGGVTFRRRGEDGDVTKDVEFEAVEAPTSKDQTLNLVPEQGTLKSNAFKKGKQKENGVRSNVIFADIVGSVNDNDDMQVRCDEGIFVPTNRRKISGTGPRGEQTRNTWDLTFTVNAKPTLKPKDSGTNVTEIFNTTDYIGKADRKLWRTNLYNNASFLNEYGICPFNTITKKNEDYDGTHVIRWEHITFPADGNYQIEIAVDDKVKLFIGNRSGAGAMGIGNELRDVNDGGDEVIIEKDGFIGGSNRSTGKSTYTRFFKKGQYRIRAELYQKPGGDFGFSGRKSYGQKDGSNISAKFVKRGDKNFLKVDGSGTAEISFRLKVDDNPRVSGIFGSKVKIGRPPNDYVLLSRRKSGNRYKEKERITGSDIFEAGREYPVETIGSSRGTGSIIKNNGRTIEYDDNIGNGFDENADLSITKIKNKQDAPNKGLNPMALAIRIRADVLETTRISPRTWNQNPMGAAFTIDAPLPPIPISPKPISEGRCPDNPTWTTRFSGGNEKWWPVTHKFRDGSRSWSKFMNRFAISPIPPLGTINSDGGGIVYRNTWNVDILHAGFYALKGTVDNGGRILVDGTERMRGGYFSGTAFAGSGSEGQGRLAGFKETSPPMHKFYLDEGKHTITVEVENKKTAKQRKIEKKIFSTQDWRNRNNVEDRVPVKFDVYGQGTTSNTDIKFVFTSEDGKDSFSFKPPKDRGDKYTYTRTRTVKVLPGTNYKVESIAGSSVEGKFANKKTYTIEYEGLNDSNSTIDFGPQLIRLKDSRGDDINSIFSIVSTSPGVEAKFSANGKALSAKGSGDVTLALKWNDNPNTAGKAVKSITIRGETFKQRGNKGKVTKVIKVGQGKLAGRSNTVDTQLNYTNLNNANKPITVVDDRTKIILKDSDGTDINAKITILDADGGSAKFSQDGQRLVTSGDITSSEVKVKINLYVDDDPDTAGVALDAVEIAGVTFRRKSGSKTDVTKTVTIQSEPEILPTDELALVPEQGTSKVFGKGKKGTEGGNKPGQIIFADIIGSANDNDDIQVRCDQGTFTPSNKRKIKGTGSRGTERRGTYDLTFRVERQGNPQQSITRDSVSYDGPRLFVIKSGSAVKLWSKFMQRNAVSPFIPPIDLDSENHLGDRTYIWKDVNFFESGQYKFLFQSDDGAILYINGNKVAESKSDFRGEASPTYAEISAGKYEIKVVCNNIRLNRNVLTGGNPTGFALKIMKDVVISETSFPWTTNPVGISAMLIPPPCPKVVKGKGVVTDIIVKDPGNGHSSPPPPGTPTIITIKDVEIDLPGINYDPNDIPIIDDIPTTLEVDNFGRITKINVPTGNGNGIVVTDTPVIDVPSLTGVGFRGTPIMQTTVVPEEVFAPEDIIQVTDLVGLTQNGYVNGKPYYGSVFSRDGRLFAGIYETTGELVPVYATLQESIANRVTTRPSAILRQGTSADSNNPNLNIPGTPQNLI